MRLLLQNLVPEIRPMIQNSLSTIKDRFTALLCNRLDSHGPETAKRFKTIALLFVVMRSRSLIESYDIAWALSRTSCDKTEKLYKVK